MSCLRLINSESEGIKRKGNVTHRKREVGLGGKSIKKWNLIFQSRLYLKKWFLFNTAEPCYASLGHRILCYTLWSFTLFARLFSIFVWSPVGHHSKHGNNKCSGQQLLCRNVTRRFVLSFPNKLFNFCKRQTIIFLTCFISLQATSTQNLLQTKSSSNVCGLTPLWKIHKPANEGKTKYLPASIICAKCFHSTLHITTHTRVGIPGGQTRVQLLLLFSLPPSVPSTLLSSFQNHHRPQQLVRTHCGWKC